MGEGGDDQHVIYFIWPYRLPVPLFDQVHVGYVIFEVWHF